MMITKKDLYEFLDYWNQEDKAEGDSKPINPYQFGGYFLSPSFHLKWYLNENDFLALTKELDVEQEIIDSGKLIFKYGDQNVEIEQYSS
ncbi:hypothetical protein [Mucilaginibacter ginsenosidivorax]|uniref:Uncharacterized protein n=1 Tax=Mucilaginibacter ginsenosidivorax TaxID=862126 RepID=A0A5B8W784_9SPHI|nr:hypothetical protein [Mucilaginibacter ginsenosidivorax]QEC79337.1 hypothetical protein FSB76_26560 [Mucilaginibacter ginsenosidivorax]